MPRELLRSRNGCDRCKARRKKCNEERPICGSCARLDLICTWSLGVQDETIQLQNLGTCRAEDDKASVLSVKRVPLSSLRLLRKHHISDAGYVPFADQVQFHFVARAARIYSAFIAPTAPKEFQDTSVITSVALEHTLARDAVAGFAAYMDYSAGSLGTKLRQEAFRLYQRGLLSVHKRLRGEADAEKSMDLLIAITFLGLMESLGTGDAEAARIHFLAAAKICQSFRPHPSWSATQLTLYRIVVECWVYNLATTAIFNSNSSLPVDDIEWSILSETFGKSSALDTRTCLVSPHLGGNHDIYRLMLQLTCFARQEVSLTDRQRQVASWSEELDNIECHLSRYFGCHPDAVAELYHSKYRLHILAFRIVLAKIRDHDIIASSNVVRCILVEVRDLIDLKNLHEQNNPALAWPFIIFLLAADDSATVEYFTLMVHRIDTNFDPGHHKRLAKVIKEVNKRKEENFENLDLLLQKDGILAPR